MLVMLGGATPPRRQPSWGATSLAGFGMSTELRHPAAGRTPVEGFRALVLSVGSQLSRWERSLEGTLTIAEVMIRVPESAITIEPNERSQLRNGRSGSAGMRTHGRNEIIHGRAESGHLPSQVGHLFSQASAQARARVRGNAALAIRQCGIIPAWSPMAMQVPTGAHIRVVGTLPFVRPFDSHP
jgi:hypothetical protein